MRVGGSGLRGGRGSLARPPGLQQLEPRVPSFVTTVCQRQMWGGPVCTV